MVQQVWAGNHYIHHPKVNFLKLSFCLRCPKTSLSVSEAMCFRTPPQKQLLEGIRFGSKMVQQVWAGHPIRDPYVTPSQLTQNVLFLRCPKTRLSGSANMCLSKNRFWSWQGGPLLEQNRNGLTGLSEALESYFRQPLRPRFSAFQYGCDTSIHLRASEHSCGQTVVCCSC